MSCIVTHIRQFRIHSEDDAVRRVSSGEGELIHEQFVVNNQSVIMPVPFDQWPLWSKALSKLAQPGDKGIGDVAARCIGAETSYAFKAFYLMTFGIECGCDGRHAQWNVLYPLPL